MDNSLKDWREAVKDKELRIHSCKPVCNELDFNL